jgi:putative membrane protein
MTIRNRKHFTLIAFAGLAVFALQAQDTSSQSSSQNGTRMDSGSNKMMKSPDVNFAMKAAQGGMAEVQMGKLAADKGNSTDVKAFGQQMVDDHTKANDDLKSVAEKEGMTLPTDMNAHQHAMYSRLEKLSGAAFDKAYVTDMVKDHQEDVKEFQKESNTGKDDQIKAFASRTLPVLQSHLDKIKSIQSNMGGSTYSTQ